jgi:hypothetical protein
MHGDKAVAEDYLLPQRRYTTRNEQHGETDTTRRASEPFPFLSLSLCFWCNE